MNEADVRTLRIIYIAQGMGATVFAAVCLFLSFHFGATGVVPTPNQLQMVLMFSLAMMVLAVAEYSMAGFLYKNVLSGKSAKIPQSISGRIKSAFIVRIGLCQGVCIFGLAAFLLCGLYGVFSVHPIYYLTGVPYLILLGVIKKTFPTKDRLEQMFNEMGGSQVV